MLTPEARQTLRATIRGLRADLARDLHDHAEGLYRLGIPADKAALADPARTWRQRLDAWLDEQVRAAVPAAAPVAARTAARDRFRREAELEAAHTLVNRLVVLRHLEATGLSKPAVLTGGWRSAGYTDFRFHAAELCQDDIAHR